jgi:hypothetical protein
MTTLSETTLMTRPTVEIGRMGTRAIVLGAIGVALGVIGFLTDESARHAFLQSYLIAYIFWLGITLGSLAVLMVQHLSGGAWGLVARRVLEASTRNLPLMVVLFVPILFSLPELYSWARPEAAVDHIIQRKAPYLNVTFFYFRAALFFAVWGALIFWLNKWSKEQDQMPAVPPGPLDRRFRMLSGPGLVLFVITITFMSVDWVMSLDPHWYSTIFGILTLGEYGLSTMAFTIFILARLVRFKPMSDFAAADHFHDLSKLMFAFVLLWAYFSVSQLIIVWSGNLPEEIPFYLDRFHGPWRPVSIAVLIGHFVIPFALLLSASLKRTPSRIAVVAVFILIMRFVETAWIIGPMVRHEGSGLHWLDFAVVLGMGGIWLFVFFRNLAGRALVPARDPYLKDALVAHGGH